MKAKKKKVFVAMSGGVDSSVAAALLKKRGFEVVGAHMKCFNVDGCGEQDAEDARRAAEVLRIPFYVFDFEKEYKEKVVEYMVDGYKKGITPNPDVMCNKEIKFGLFLKKALEMDADFVATGHYVRLVSRKNILVSTRSSATADSLLLARLADRGSAKTIGPGKAAAQVSAKNIFSLITARDNNKDQSYFLWTLTQQQLQHCLFPIGDYKKPEVRKLAKKFGLPNAEKKDSQGVCFLGQISLKDFLGNYLPKKKGLILNTAGQVVGEHDGAHLYTIGQRHTGVSYQVSGTEQKPFYVAEKDIQENAILVAEENHPALYQKEIKLRNVNFINPQHSNILQNVRMLPVLARVRYRQPLASANLKLINLKTYKLAFAQPQKFVASGQSAVFYDAQGAMLGGGVIV